MPRFRKKPVVIEAHRVRPQAECDSITGYLERSIALAEWCGGVSRMMEESPRIEISTLEGVMSAVPGDFIIKGVKGEFYPCKPDIFDATYEAAD